MGRHRSAHTSDELYALRRTRYLKNRERLAVVAKARYQQERGIRSKINHTVAAALKAARLEEKRRQIYGRAYVLPAEQEYQDVRTFLQEYKTAHPCLDCQKHYPAHVMDFDHVRGIKVKDISSLMSFTTVRREMEKCDLVCANCHRIRTFHRANLPK